MAIYQDLFDMLRDIRSFVQETGAAIEIHDDPYNLKLGYSARAVVDGQEFTKIWQIGIRALKESMAGHPDERELFQSFACLAGRRELARSLSVGTTGFEPAIS